MAYVWTGTPPKQPGWYVFKYHHEPQEPEATRAVCLQLVEADGALWVQPDDEDADWEKLDELVEGLWKGPLDLEAL